jgi:two-component system sensor histidine kinase UhpB
MSLRFRLIALVWVLLPISLAFGGLAAWVNASRSVRVEMLAARQAARQTIETAIERLRTAPDPARYRDELVASFSGNRHLRVWLVGAPAAGSAPAVERPPRGVVPVWFVRIIGVEPMTDRVPVVVGDYAYGTIIIETDPSNEILEVWNEFAESLVMPVVFSGLLILLIYVLIGRALRPLGRLAAAMEDVGEGRYRTRIDGKLTPELARLSDSFNRMAARLAEADSTNRRLNEQLLTLQDQERSELARDLHDEVSPFLFAINIDAAGASRRLEEGRTAEAGGHILSITEAVRHMQRQVRHMLGRLRPIGLAEFGLREAIENLVAFWRRRRPDLRYQVEISADCEDLGELVGTTVCRVVREALSNAVRHAEAALVTISIERRHDALEDHDEIRVVVADDGQGMREPNRLGYGLVGVRERVTAVGGRLTFSNRSGKGFQVTATLPCAPAQSPLTPSLAVAEP